MDTEALLTKFATLHDKMLRKPRREKYFSNVRENSYEEPTANLIFNSEIKHFT